MVAIGWVVVEGIEFLTEVIDRLVPIILFFRKNQNIENNTDKHQERRLTLVEVPFFPRVNVPNDHELLCRSSSKNTDIAKTSDITNNITT